MMFKIALNVRNLKMSTIEIGGYQMNLVSRCVHINRNMRKCQM